jgi:hypothetical protein
MSKAADDEAGYESTPRALHAAAQGTQKVRRRWSMPASRTAPVESAGNVRFPS